MSCPNFTFVQQLLMGFWIGKLPLFLAHFRWIHSVLSHFQHFRRTFSQNTFPSLCFKPIFLGRSGYQLPKKSPKSPRISSCFLLVFTKIQPRFSRFPLIQEVELHDFIIHHSLAFSPFVLSFHKQSLTWTKLAKNSKFWHSSSFSILRKKQGILSSNNAKVTKKTLSKQG